MNMIEKAVAPLKSEAMDRAAQFAQQTIEGVRKAMAECDGDRQVCAPYPDSLKLGRVAYMIGLGRYNTFRSLTKARVDGQIRRMRGPDFGDIDAAKCAKFIAEARDNAAVQYDAFVRKLVQKIGDVKDAVLRGNHVWSYSLLTVTKTNGTVECWKTQQIINVSKLGKVFNQWPTRKQK